MVSILLNSRTLPMYREHQGDMQRKPGKGMATLKAWSRRAEGQERRQGALAAGPVRDAEEGLSV